MVMITDVNEYFAKGCGRCDRFATPECSTRRWLKGITDLRRIALDMGLSEHAKWGHPVFMHADRNIAIIGAFREHFRFGFMNASLMKDPEGVLVKSGPNTQHAENFHFTANDQVEASEPVIRAYLKEAMGYAEAGIKPVKQERQIDMPEELIDALDADSELAEAFEALTPGRQKSYYFVINQAKQSATRVSRIEKFRDKIIAGKGAQERWP